MDIHTCNPSFQKPKTGGLRIQGWSKLHSEILSEKKLAAMSKNYCLSASLPLTCLGSCSKERALQSSDLPAASQHRVERSYTFVLRCRSPYITQIHMYL